MLFIRVSQAPKSTVEVELAAKKNVELRSMELSTALKKPKTTVVEIRAFERCEYSSDTIWSWGEGEGCMKPDTIVIFIKCEIQFVNIGNVLWNMSLIYILCERYGRKCLKIFFVSSTQL